MIRMFSHRFNVTGISNIHPLHTTPVNDHTQGTVIVTISHEFPVPTMVCCVPVTVLLFGVGTG